MRLWILAASLCPLAACSDAATEQLGAAANRGPRSDLVRGVDAGAQSADAGGSRRDAGLGTDVGTDGRPDAGRIDFGDEAPCRFAQLDPVQSLHEGDVSRHDVVRGPNGYFVVVVRRADSGFFHPFLYRLPDDGTSLTPEDLTPDADEGVNGRDVTLVSDGDVLWVGYTLNRWLGGSDYVDESWLIEVTGEPPYRRVKIGDRPDGPRRLVPRPDGGMDVFFGHFFVPRAGAASIVRLDRNLRVTHEGGACSKTRSGPFPEGIDRPVSM